jgi:hypothetical protein
LFRNTQLRFFVRTKPFTAKKKPKKEVDFLRKHQTSTSDYDNVFDNSISFRQKDLLRIQVFRIPGVPGLSGRTHLLHFAPWHRGRGCLAGGAATPVTGVAAEDYNLTVVDRDVSVLVLTLLQ